MAAVTNDTLRGEMFLNTLPNLTSAATLNAWRERYEKDLFSDAQKQRLQNHIAHLAEQAAQPQDEAPRGNNNQRVPLAANTPAPNFTYNDINGNPVSLSDFKGKVVYIDIWATWCGPCRQEIPHLKALKEKYKDNENIVIIGISADGLREAEVQRWRDFVINQELTGVQLHGRTDGDDDVAALFGVRALPHFVLIDQQGYIVSGHAPRASSADIVPMIEQLLQ
jgi:thiol-disulfide isomerase/thioredoxin